MSSAWERIIRRQQYRFRPSSSRTFLGSSPPRVRSMNAGNELPTTLPHVKHRTGIIMGSPVRLLPLLPRPATQRLLRQLAPGVRDDQRAIVFAEDGLEIVVIQVLNEAAGDRRADRVRFPHHAAALYVHVDVDRVDLLPRELQRLQDFQPPQLERIDFDRHAVDPDDAAPLRERRSGDGRLALSARDNRLHRVTSNLDPRSLEISPRLMNGPWGGRFATSTTSRGLSLNASGTERYTRRRFKASRPRGC